MGEEKCQNYTSPPVEKCSQYCNATQWQDMCDRMGLGRSTSNNFLLLRICSAKVELIFKNKTYVQRHSIAEHP